MQLEELMFDIEAEGLLVMKDYLPSLDHVEKVHAELSSWTYEELWTSMPSLNFLDSPDK